MAIISEEFVRCKGCGCPEFIKIEVVTIPKGVKRENKTMPLPVMETQISYNCSRCGVEYE